MCIITLFIMCVFTLGLPYLCYLIGQRYLVTTNLSNYIFTQTFIGEDYDKFYINATLDNIETLKGMFPELKVTTICKYDRRWVKVNKIKPTFLFCNILKCVYVYNYNSQPYISIESSQSLDTTTYFDKSFAPQVEYLEEYNNNEGIYLYLNRNHKPLKY